MSGIWLNNIFYLPYNINYIVYTDSIATRYCLYVDLLIQCSHVLPFTRCCVCGECSLRVVSKDPQVSRQNQWGLFQVTCRPNIPVSDPQFSAVFIFIFSSCLSVVAVNVVAVSKDPCCLYEHVRFMLCK